MARFTSGAPNAAKWLSRKCQESGTDSRKVGFWGPHPYVAPNGRRAFRDRGPESDLTFESEVSPSLPGVGRGLAPETRCGAGPASGALRAVCESSFREGREGAFLAWGAPRVQCKKAMAEAPRWVAMAEAPRWVAMVEAPQGKGTQTQTQLMWDHCPWQT